MKNCFLLFLQQSKTILFGTQNFFDEQSQIRDVLQKTNTYSWLNLPQATNTANTKRVVLTAIFFGSFNL